MKPQSYLTDRGQQIFYEIVACIDEKVLQDTDSFGLSVLANNYDLHHTMAEYINDKGVTQVTKTDYSQVKAEYTVYQKTAEYISKNADSFGLNPAARERLKEVWSKKEKKKHSLMDNISVG